MTRALAVCLVTLGVISTSAAEGKAGPEGTPRQLVVRAYNPAHVDSAGIHTAGTVVRDTFRHAGILVSWLDCSREPLRATTECDQPPGRMEIVARILTSSGSSPFPAILGSSLFQNGIPTTQVTIWADRVDNLARSAGADAGTLLGRAIAHEIGHVLLSTTRHTSRGLMRAEWTDHELIRNEPLDWTFGSEARLLRRGLADREKLQADNADVEQADHVKRVAATCRSRVDLQ